MKINLLGPLVLLVFSSIITSGQPPSGAKYYVTFNFGLTWEEAQHFCHSYFTDLANIYTWSEAHSINLKQYWMWVGLHRDWWARYPSPHWAKNEPQHGSCAAVHLRDKKFYSEDCRFRLMFFCWDGDNYMFVNKTKSWHDAWNYCEEHHEHLTRFSKSDLNEIFTEMDIPVWVGKHKEGGSFKWTSGSSGYENWTAGELTSRKGDCVTISSLTKLLATEDCNIPLPFVCMWDGNPKVLVVKENKTWEEALEHCRGLDDDGFRFDLVSVQPGDEYEYITTKVMEADTEEVWIGLGFLGDEWLWVNGADMLNTTLPQCPMWEQHCGALSKNNTDSVQTRECSERKNFLCYGFPP